MNNEAGNLWIETIRSLNSIVSDSTRKTIKFHFCLITNCGLFVLWHKNCSHLSSVYALWREHIKLTMFKRIATLYRETFSFHRHFSTKINFTLLFFRRQQRLNTGEQLDCFCSSISQFRFFTLVISMCWESSSSMHHVLASSVRVVVRIAWIERKSFKV